jgi:hypothetical protein
VEKFIIRLSLVRRRIRKEGAFRVANTLEKIILIFGRERV